MRTHLIIKCGLLLLLAMTTASGLRIYGQCEGAIYDQRTFASVSDQYRDHLVQRVDKFLQLKCEENLGEVYEMMHSSFREANKKDQFVQEMQRYYAGRDRFVSFTPSTVSEFRSSDNRLISFWFIDGCATEIINGKRRSKMSVLEAYIEDGEIFFTDITTRPNPL